MRTLRLTLTTARRAKSRIVFLAILVALGMTVMAVVTELSRQSTQGLDAAIEEDTGGSTGTYRFAFSSTLGLSPAALADAVVDASAPLVIREPQIIEMIPPQKPECPPFEQFGDQAFLVVRDADLRPVDLPFGETLPDGTAFCVAGVRLGADVVYLPSDAQLSQWGIGLAVRSDIAELAALNTTGPISWSFILVTGRSEGMADELAQRIEESLAPVADRTGLQLSDVLSYSRVDGASSVRAASEGIALVYSIIGWGILLLAGIGLLISQTIIVSQRMWFFGLTRALGASRRQIAVMVLLEVCLVLIAGTALAIVALLALQPAAADLARDAFQVDAQLLRGSTVPLLITGAVVVLGVAGIYPAYRAVRGDPLDVLEPSLS